MADHRPETAAGHLMLCTIIGLLIGLLVAAARYATEFQLLR